MNWTDLNAEDQLETITEESKTQPVIIFKHSTTCNISRMMLTRLERNWEPGLAAAVKPYFLDLKTHRALSDSVASFFHVPHECPQLLIIRNGDPVNVTSHLAIDFENIKKVI